MGWLFGHDTRKDLIEHLTKSQDNEHASMTTLARKFSGNNMWTVQEVTRKDSGVSTRFICVYLMRRSGDSWGYKDVSEEMGPCETSCPLSFLDMVPDPGGFATAWRERVREFHKRVGAKLHVGQLIALTNGKLYDVVSLRPLRARGADGVTYRIPRTMLSANVPEVAVQS